MARKAVIVGMVLMIAIGYAFSGLANAGLIDGLVAYYPFNGNAFDETMNGNNPALNNATLTKDRFGMPESAYDFYGNYIAINDSTSLRFGSEDFSVSLWLISYDSTGTQNIMSKDWFIRLNDGKNGGKITFWVGSGSVPVATVNGVTASDSKWHHIVAIRKSGTLSIYVDGTLMGAVSGPIIPINSTIPLYIGVRAREGYSPDIGLSGSMDNIRLYKRALTEAEIIQLSSEGCSLKISQFFPATGGSGILHVSATSTDCNMWIATKNVAWLRITSKKSLMRGKVIYTVMPNHTGKDRIGIITVGNQQTTILQSCK